MTSRDPRDTINASPMSAFQILAVALTVALLGLDGFDVLSISFAAPGIAAEWKIDRAALGIVLSMELFGMAAGAFSIGALADRIGRRPAIIGCLCGMAAGMFLCATAHGVAELSAFRFLTGIGIGGMLASANSMTAEYANDRRRHLCVSLTTIGYPLGAIAGGMLAAHLLAGHGWRSVFLIGGFASIVCLPLVIWRLPESIAFLVARRPGRALSRINRVLFRMGHEPIDALPPPPGTADRQPAPHFLRGDMRHFTILLSLACFFHMATFYFILKWVPKIVVDLGFAPSSAAGVLVWANVGGATGGLLFGLATARFRLLPLSVGVLALSTIMVTVFGRSGSSLFDLSLLAATAGMFTNSAMVGLYAIAAQGFPTETRAAGTGFVIGVGRGGAAFSPVLAGYLFKTSHGLPSVAMILASGSLLAACCLIVAFWRQPSHEAPTDDGRLSA